MDEARLRDGVGDRGAGRPEARDRGDVDDASRALLLHHRADGLGQQHRAGQVDVDDLGPFLVGQAVEIGEGDRLVVGGIVHEDVEPAETLHDIVDQALDLVALGHIAGKGGGRNLVLFEIAGDSLGLVLALGIDDGDVAALRRQRMTDALAKPAIAAGDDSHPALEIHCPPS